MIAAKPLPAEQSLRSAWANDGWAVDPELGWTLLPNSESMRGGARCKVNSLGIRGPEVLARKPPDALRILSIGDSTVMGFGVAYEKTFSSLLRDRLEVELGRPVEMINAGVAGYSSEQALIYLRRRGLMMQPDLIIFESNFNDRRAVPSSGEPDSAEFFRSIYRRLRYRELMLSSATFRLVDRAFRAAGPAADVVESGDYAFKEISIDAPARVSLARFEANVRAIVTISREAGAGVILVGLPDNPEVVRDIVEAKELMQASRWPEAELALIRSDATRMLKLLSQPMLNELFRKTGRTREVQQTVRVNIPWMSLDGYTPVSLSQPYLGVLESVAREMDAPFVVPTKKEIPESLYLDYIHLNERGHEILADQLVAPALRLSLSGDTTSQ